ncbi:glutamate--tRNA ligase [Desulfosporosinus sp. PR]|uniref:glutamate--tRNA ligase n=1 Tax=Candidatus Desulfosporosinus nitrosoreducens TaxID=3401928 RepID=UPI0027FD884C|nr:glutamate--tRNA ligase [Desulfosporosinus sp. PR]MDQ7095292.1 glutamate--tRNA ligase [Desulfosporosinus sp. PR]
MEKVRVRFAPSPTGYLHIGGARTALFNWLFAKNQNGKLILRIEDTDTERLKEDSVSQILSSLRWLGIDWDEGPEKGGDFGPYFQSQRQEFYTKAAQRLIQENKAYHCFCSAEEIEQERRKQRQAGTPFRYQGKCRDLSPEEVQSRLKQGVPSVIRMKVPTAGQVVIEDVIRGTVSFEAGQFDDFIIMKSNGTPAYNFACVVDDKAMEISHVIRAEEHLSNTPKQWLIYQALGYEIPIFAHLSMILAPDRSKLSKRHGATAVGEFQEMGCLPEALVNYLTLLGWSPSGEQGELISPVQTIPSFALEKVSKTAAVYDVQKLIWLNGQYMTAADADSLTSRALPFFIKAGLINALEAKEKREYIRDVVNVVKEKVRTLEELAEASRCFFQDVADYEEKGIEKYFIKQEGVGALLSKGRECLIALDCFDVENVERAYRQLMDELKIKGGIIIHPTRLALTGRTVSPGLFEVMALLGKEKCLERLDKAIVFINEKLKSD